MEPDRLTLGDFIRQAREAKKPKMSQGKLARLTHLSRPTISLLERGETDYPRVPTLEAIARVLDIDPAKLIELAGLRLPSSASAQVQWIADQLDETGLETLIELGRALVLVRQRRREAEAPEAGRPEPRGL